METADDLVLFKTGFFKNLFIWKKSNLCSGLSRSSENRKQTVFKFDDRNTAAKSIVVNLAVS